MFGGTNLSATYSETWFFNASLNQLVDRWTELSPASSPSARSFSAMTWDPTLDGVLLFGGQSGTGGPLNDTWLYKNGTWAEIHPANSPSPRWGSSMAFDSTDGIAYLFGGTNGNTLYSDTWEFRNGTWTELNYAIGPGPRYDLAMSTTEGGYPVVFGGFGENGPLNDTWMYHNGSWQNLTSLFTPGPPTPSTQGGVVMVASDSLYPNSFILIEGTPSQPSSFMTWMLGIPFGGNPGGLVVGITESASKGLSPLAVRFEAVATGGTPPYNYTWTFSDTGGQGYGIAISHVFNSSLQTNVLYSISLAVTDSRGDRGVTTVSVTVLAPPPTPPKPPPPPYALYAFSAVLVGLVVAGSYYLTKRARAAVVSRRELREIRKTLDIVREKWSISHALSASWKRLNGVFTWLARTALNVVSKVLIAVTAIFFLLQLETSFQCDAWHFHGCVNSVVFSWANFVWGFFSGSWLTTLMPVGPPSNAVSVPFYTLISQSLELGFIALVISIVIAYPIGLLAGWYRGGVVDNAARTYSTFSLYFPTIILSFLLIGVTYSAWYSFTGSEGSVFGILPNTAVWYIGHLGNVPNWLTLIGTTTPTGFPIIDSAVHGAWSLEELVLAKTVFQAAIIAIVYSSIYLRYLRVAMAEATEEPYIVAGRARGISERTLLWRHAGRRALPLYISVFSTTFSAFLLTVAVVELAFSDIGIGSIVWSGDIGLLVPVVFVFVIAVVITNVTADGLVRMLDKRVTAGRLV
jgi:peptide/nickel transport system permease protein